MAKSYALLTRIFKTSYSRKFKLSTSPYTPHVYIPCGPRITRPSTRKLKKRKRNNVAWNMSGLTTTLLLPQLPVGIQKTWVISSISTVTRAATTQHNVPSQGRIEISQKTSDSLGNLRIDETNVEDAQEATLKQVPSIRYPITFPENPCWLRKWSQCHTPYFC